MASVAPALNSLASLGSVTALPERNRIACWWTAADERRLRVFGSETDRAIQVDFEVTGSLPLLWDQTTETLVAATLDTAYRVTLGGESEELAVAPGESRPIPYDVDDGRLLYHRNGDPWTLRLHNLRDETDRALIEHPAQAYHAGFSPDGDRVAFRRNPDDEFGAGTPVIHNLSDGREQSFSVADSDCRTRLHGWFPDGERLVVSDRSADRDRVGVYDLADDSVAWLSPGPHVEKGRGVSPNGERVFADRYRDGRVQLIAYDPDTGEGRELDLSAGETTLAAWTRPWKAFLDPGTVLLTHEAPTTPPRLLRYDLAADEYEVLLNTDTADLDYADAEYVRYDSTDEFEIGAVYYPVAGDDGDTPAVVDVHGGPWGRVGLGFDAFAQYLHAQGYAVLQPNYRGSTGRGRAFEDAINDDLGGGEVADVLAGVEWLRDRPEISPDRVAIHGHSHGAYNAAMCAIEGDPAATVVYNGYLNLFRNYTDGNPTVMRRAMGVPGADHSHECFIQRSPVFRADEATSPVLLLYGSEDAVGQAEAFADRAPEATLDVVESEGHVFESEKRRFRAVGEFLERV
jgi:dipeptidyl aminopeptidase/acylaminoacyl peptidase